MSEGPDPNVNFNAALAAAVRAQQQAEADQARDDTGEPTEQPGTGSRRPLSEQINEEAAEVPQPRDPQTQQFMSPNDPLARFGSSPQTHEMDDPGTIPPPDADQGVPTPDETPEQQAERLLAGRYQSPEELEQAYLGLEQQQGAQGQEMGNLRAELSALQQRLAMGTAAQPIQPTYMPPLSADQIDQGLMRGDAREFIANLYEQEHPSYSDVLDRALEVNPRLAIQWTSDVSAWEAEQRIRSELGPAIAAVSVPVQNATSRDAWNRAWQDVAAANPEINGLSTQILADLEANQWLAAPMREGVPDAEKLVLGNLLSRARDANRDKLAEARTELAEEDGRVKTAATVATGSASAPRGGPSQQSDDVATAIKQSILSSVSGHNVHEAIHGSGT